MTIITKCTEHIVNLNIPLLFHLQAGSSPVSNVSGVSGASILDDFKEDPFKGKDPFNNTGDNFAQIDPFQNEDPFKDSKF